MELIARRVTQAEGEALAKKLNSGFIESSAKDNKNVGACCVWSAVCLLAGFLPLARRPLFSPAVKAARPWLSCGIKAHAMDYHHHAAENMLTHRQSVRGPPRRDAEGLQPRTREEEVGLVLMGQIGVVVDLSIPRGPTFIEGPYYTASHRNPNRHT